MRAIFSLAILVVGLSAAQAAWVPDSYQFPQQAQRVQTHEQVESTAKGQGVGGGEDNTARETAAATPPSSAREVQAEGSAKSDQGTESGSEFWPILGHSVKITDTMLVAFTLLLFVATMLLWRSTKGLVDTTVAGARAYVFPGNPEPALSPTRLLYVNTPTSTYRPKAFIDFVNYGTSPAVIKRIRAELYIGDVLPNFPTFTYSPTHVGDAVLAKESHSKVIECAYSNDLPDAQIQAIIDGKVGVWLFGYIEYEDFFGFLHRKGFCNDFPATNTVSGVRETGGSAYNYTRSKKMKKQRAPLWVVLFVRPLAWLLRDAPGGRNHRG